MGLFGSLEDEDDFALNTHCKFVDCGWFGDRKILRCHVEGCHHSAVISAGASGRYDLTADDLQKEALLLCGCGNQYWFLHNFSSAGNCVEKGVFAVGDAEITSYMLKLRKETRRGLFGSNSSVDYLGPFQVREESSNSYDIYISYRTLTDGINITLFLGQTQTERVEQSTSRMPNASTSSRAQTTDRSLSKKFECVVCWDVILQNARFCGRGHFVCDNCFKEVMKLVNKVCPVCREEYLEITQSADIENLLKGLNLQNN